MTTVSPQAAIMESQNHEFCEIPTKFQPHRNKKSREFPAPWPTPFLKLGMTSMAWNISIGQLGYLSGSAPSQLLHPYSWAEYEKLEKSPWFHSNNWKHQSYELFLY